MRLFISCFSIAIFAFPGFAQQETEISPSWSLAKVVSLERSQLAENIRKDCEAPAQIYQINLNSKEVDGIYMRKHFLRVSDPENIIPIRRGGEVMAKERVAATNDQKLPAELLDAQYEVSANLIACISHFSSRVLQGDMRIQAESTLYILDEKVSLNSAMEHPDTSVLLLYNEIIFRKGKLYPRRNLTPDSISKDVRPKDFQLIVRNLPITSAPKTPHLDPYQQILDFRISFRMQDIESNN